MSSMQVDSLPRPGDAGPMTKATDPSSSESSPLLRSRSPEDPHNELDEVAHESRSKRFVLVIRDVFQMNIGLFLITLAQFAFSWMNLAVKKLDSLDPPVPMMEVSFIQICL